MVESKRQQSGCLAALPRYALRVERVKNLSTRMQCEVGAATRGREGQSHFTMRVPSALGRSQVN